MKTPNQCVILPVTSQEQLVDAQSKLFDLGFAWKGTGFEYLDKEIGNEEGQIACLICYSNRSVISLDDDISSPEKEFKAAIAAKELAVSLLKVMRISEKDIGSMPDEIRNKTAHLLKEIEEATDSGSCTCDLCCGCIFTIIEDADEFVAAAVKNRKTHLDRLQKPLLISA